MHERVDPLSPAVAGGLRLCCNWRARNLRRLSYAICFTSSLVKVMEVAISRFWVRLRIIVWNSKGMSMHQMNLEKTAKRKFSSSKYFLIFHDIPGSVQGYMRSDFQLWYPEHHVGHPCQCVFHVFLKRVMASLVWLRMWSETSAPTFLYKVHRWNTWHALLNILTLMYRWSMLKESLNHRVRG